jgi:hypothetical protein
MDLFGLILDVVLRPLECINAEEFQLAWDLSNQKIPTPNF